VGPMPAIRQYRVPPCCIKTQHVAVLCEGSLREHDGQLYSMADCSTTTKWISILFAGGHEARRQLRTSIRYVPVASKPRIPLTSVERVLGSMLVQFYSIADCSTTAGPIPTVFARDSWAPCQLRNGIRDVPVASKPQIALTSLEGVLGSMLAELYSIADYSTPGG